MVNRITICLPDSQKDWLQKLPRSFKLSAFIREKIDELMKESEKEAIEYEHKTEGTGKSAVCDNK